MILNAKKNKTFDDSRFLVLNNLFNKLLDKKIKNYF